MANKGTITLKDEKGNLRTMRFKAGGGKLFADVGILNTTLIGYTDCETRAVGFVEKSYAPVDGGGNADRKGIVTVADADGETHKWALSGYNGASETDKQGEHMIDPDLAAIVAAIEVFTGESYTVLRSPVIQTR